MQGRILRCYKGSSLIENPTLGVATTLAYVAIANNFCIGFLTVHHRSKTTFIARNKNELKESCGSIYTRVQYRKLRQPNLGQIGKPCDMDYSYSPRISLFCSRKTWNPKCIRLFCKDHIGKKADIGVGHSHNLPGPFENVFVVWTELGQNLVDLAIASSCIKCQEVGISKLKDAQPYLWG